MSWLVALFVPLCLPREGCQSAFRFITTIFNQLLASSNVLYTLTSLILGSLPTAMKLTRSATFWLLPFQCALTAPSSSGSSVSISSEAPNGAPVVPKDVVSFSIEYRHLSQFTGSLDEPNEFSKNLLDNLKNLTGKYPLIRVGGGSQ